MMLALLLASGSVTNAEEKTEPVLSDKIKSTIVSQCDDLIAKLKTIDQDDIATRIIRGRIYQTDITDRLMLPLNRRVTDSRLDGSALVSVTASYDAAVRSFSASYSDYEDSMTKLIRIDCKNEPTQFYDALSIAREKRLELADSVSSLQSLIVSYRDRVNDFVNSEIEASDDGKE